MKVKFKYPKLLLIAENDAERTFLIEIQSEGLKVFSVDINGGSVQMALPSFQNMVQLHIDKDAVRAINFIREKLKNVL